ncbi:hypothetical protein LBMAG42_53760 [Deltaproteobacteria bacterium]|nr:hypothetical protein LBMAG42_53760 [Deltaproteobacteria bacterium]
MLVLLLLACDDRGASPPPPVPSEPVSIDGLGGGSSTMGIPIPPPLPAMPLKTDVCADWADGVVVPAKFSIVECNAGRLAMSGRADLLESCAEVQVGLRRAGWADTSAGTFRYALSRSDRSAELVCVETPAGIIVTITAQ